MNSADDRNDGLVSAVEKLEWVTPKLSLMAVVDMEGKPVPAPSEAGTGSSARGS